MNRVLMVAYHFPPMVGSSGIQRTLRFVRDLPKHGWQPAVLTVHPRAYERRSDDLIATLPSDLQVTRAFALDVRQHLSLWHRYPAWLARPDRWASWLLGAIPAGLALIQRFRPDVIWSTYPIATAHLIGRELARLSGLPWVADFRDPMAHQGYPTDPKTWESFLRVEQKVFALAEATVFSTPGASALYVARYPAQARRMHVIENGYDEDSFQQAESDGADGPLNPGCITFLHSGIVYPEWRDPRALFGALRQLVDSSQLDASSIRIRFRAPEHDSFVKGRAREVGLQHMVEVLPAIGYQEALQEMLRADALLVLQAATCNDQIPAKLYEYFRARRPILALATPKGDTGQAALSAGVQAVAPLEDAMAVACTITRLLQAMAAGSPLLANEAAVTSCARSARAHQLAQLFNNLRRT